MLDATLLLRLYAKYRTAKLASQVPGTTQKNELLALIRKASDTKFGRDHAFREIGTVEEYQKRVPLRYYEAFWNEYWKDAFPHFKGTTWPDEIHYIPVSSGTSSGATKWIPCSNEMIASNTKASLDLLIHHLNARPDSKIFGGKNFILGGSTDLVERAPGIFSGDLSGIAVKTLPWWARMRYFPPQEIALLKDWEHKIDILARRSVKEDIRNLSGVPNWILILIEKLRTLNPEAEGLIKDFYPDLELLIHGGVNFRPYLKKFEELLDGSKAELREVYPASEGFIAVADRWYGEGLRLVLDHGIFFEFVPVEELSSPSPTRHWVETIEPDLNYAIVLTTCAGLWSYVLGDTVKFIDTQTPRLLITGRTSYYISAFGEHLIGEEIEDAVAMAANQAVLAVTDYSMGAIYPTDSDPLGGHLFVVEFADELPSASALSIFSEALDKHLSFRNEDYDAHRQNNFGFKAPLVVPASPGMFASWMKSRGKLGGQNKVPRIILKDELLTDLKQFNETW